MEGVPRPLCGDCDVSIHLGATKTMNRMTCAKIFVSLEKKDLETDHTDGPREAWSRISKFQPILQKLEWESIIATANGLKKTSFWNEDKVEKVWSVDFF